MTEYIVAAVVAALLLIVLACSLLGGAHWALNRWRPNGPDVGMALVVEDPTEDEPEPVAIEPPPPFERTNLGFGRRNPHCSNCGDLRGGYFGHEASECKYRYGMTASEVAAILPEHQRNAFWDEQIDRYFADQERAS